jgi:anionic cell wall polymer biosynthesis LytR-Cps2A-Psr (LCP) family protein
MDSFRPETNKRKKRKGGIALAFLISFVLALIIVGIVAQKMLKYVRENELEKGGVSDINAANIPTADDNMTLLFTLEPDNKLTEPYTFVVFRFIPESAKMYIFPLPAETMANVTNQRDTLSVFYTNYGIVKLKQAVENVIGCEVDRYLSCNVESFKQIVEIFGGATYLVPNDFEEEFGGNGALKLTGDEFLKIITYNNYKGGEKERVTNTATILWAMFNQSRKAALAETLEDNFITIKDSIDTDIDSSFFYNHLTAAQYLLENSSSPAEYIIPKGTYSPGGIFMMDTEFTAKKVLPKFQIEEDE